MGSDFPPRAPTVGLILVWNDQYAPNREWSRLVCLEWWIFTQAFINIFLVATIQIYSQFFRLSWNQLLAYRQIHFIKVDTMCRWTISFTSECWENSYFNPAWLRNPLPWLRYKISAIWEVSPKHPRDPFLDIFVFYYIVFVLVVFVFLSATFSSEFAHLIVHLHINTFGVQNHCNCTN